MYLYDVYIPSRFELHRLTRICVQLPGAAPQSTTLIPGTKSLCFSSISSSLNALLHLEIWLRRIRNEIYWLSYYIFNSQPVLINSCPSHIRITKLSFEPIVGGSCVFTWFQIQGILFFLNVNSSRRAEWTRGGCALNSENASFPAEKRAEQQCCFRTSDAHFWQVISSGAWCLPAESWTMHQASERKSKQSPSPTHGSQLWKKWKQNTFIQPNEDNLNIVL
jgi:hypothetical protein